MLTTVAKDSVTFTLNEADLTGKKVGEGLLTPKRDIPYSDGLQYGIEWYPAGYKDAYKDHVSVYLEVNKPIKATFMFTVNGSSISKTYTYEFAYSEDNYGFGDFASHEELRPLFRDGKLTITCSIFDIKPAKPANTIKDYTSFTLCEADLIGKKVGEDLLTPKRDIPNAYGLQWWIQWYPAGKTATDKGYVSVYLWVNKNVKAKFTFANKSSLTNKTDILELTDDTLCNGQNKYASHKKLRPLFEDGKLTITCSVKFDVLAVGAIHDTFTFTLNEVDLTEMNVGEEILTSKRTVPCSDRLQWWIEYFPAGDGDDVEGFVSLYLWTNKPVKANYVVVIDGTSISKTGSEEFTETPDNYGFSQYASHEELCPLFRDGKLTITCSAEFTSSIQAIPATPAIYETVEYTTPDFDLVIDSKRIPVHKYLLALVSPVYCELIENRSSTESKNKEHVITGFDYDVIKTAIDYYYGRELKLLSSETYVGVLRFAHKMEMKKITAVWEKLILSNLSKVTFCDFLQYADTCKKDALLDECYKYFKTNQEVIKVTKSFVKLPPTFAINFLKAAFGLESDDQALRHAHIHDIGFIRDYFNEDYLNPLSIENFSITASYAWEFSQENLQKACAQFLNDNREMVTTDDAFLNLPPETVRSVLQFAKRKRDAEAEHSAGVTAKRAKLEVST
uniref:BTB domain-containing protein n=1 Tax=Panagrellus redivivus TaxID=6233 RepID=A0A7E5A099_PANRE